MADNRRPSRGPSSRGRSGRGRTGPGAPGRTRVPATASGARPERVRPRLTGRAAILVLVLAVLVVSYASSMRAYLQQRAHIADLNAKIDQRQQSIDDLSTEAERWKDPAYLEQQARLTKGYVAPGERTFVVLDADGNRVQGDASLDDPATALAPQEPTAWWSTAWESVELAGHPPKVGKPPAATIDGSAESGQ